MLGSKALLDFYTLRPDFSRGYVIQRMRLGKEEIPIFFFHGKTKAISTPNPTPVRIKRSLGTFFFSFP